MMRLAISQLLLDIISDILGLKFDHFPLSLYGAIRFMVIKIH